MRKVPPGIHAIAGCGRAPAVLTSVLVWFVVAMAIACFQGQWPGDAKECRHCSGRHRVILTGHESFVRAVEMRHRATGTKAKVRPGLPPHSLRMMRSAGCG